MLATYRATPGFVSSLHHHHEAFFCLFSLQQGEMGLQVNCPKPADYMSDYPLPEVSVWLAMFQHWAGMVPLERAVC